VVEQRIRVSVRLGDDAQTGRDVDEHGGVELVERLGLHPAGDLLQGVKVGDRIAQVVVTATCHCLASH